MHRLFPRVAALFLCCGFLLSEGIELPSVNAATPEETLKRINQIQATDLLHSAIGVTRRGTAINSLIHEQDIDFFTPKMRILLVGGLDGSANTVEATLAAVDWFYNNDIAAPLRKRYLLSAVPCANPDGLLLGKGPNNGVGGNPTRGYPPKGDAYNSKSDPEAAYLWRWIGMHTPDLVVEVRLGESLSWQVPKSTLSPLKQLAARLTPLHSSALEDSLVNNLVKTAPSETGVVPALQVNLPKERNPSHDFLPVLLKHLDALKFKQPSPARLELQSRQKRTPVEVAAQLSRHYGHNLNQVAYIPALALIGRVRLGQLTNDPSHLKDVEQIVLPYLKGDKLSTPKSGSGLSGHLIFCELANAYMGEKGRSEGKKRDRYIKLARVAADLGFDKKGKPVEVMPFHVEMSDSLFMGGPILARVGRLTGDDRYYEACANHLDFMRRLDQREDGIYRNSPLSEAAWGRGNGFPALGLAICLTDFPADHPRRKELLKMYRRHIAALAPHQDPTGCWRQVIDKPGAYRELTSTCMITFAMIRGVRNGWLEKELYQPRIEKAWRAILTRAPANGRLVDVCTGTGKQKSLHAYYDRKAILGPDPRGGAMALMVSTELAAWRSEQKAALKK